MKSILIHADDDPGLHDRLAAALDVARAFEGHLQCLQTTPYDSFILADPFGGVYALPAVLDQVRESEEAHRAAVEQRLNGAGIAWDWVHGDGDAAQLIVDRGRLADLIVLSLPPRDGSARALSRLADVAVHARTPVLAVPAGHGRIDCSGTALVAWNGSAEASHALRSALPLLRRAAAVHIVTVCDDRTDFPATEACEYCARHGLAPTLHEWPREERSVAQALLDAAATLKADYLVSGAYGHSRIRQAVLGGTTRDLVEHSPIPLILAH